jgi:tetratricopeptide (TPR) repeat protein
VGRTFSAALLEELEPTQSEVVLDALEDAERAQLVVAQSSGREPRYRFTHELIRQTLADGLSLPRRQRLHARIAAAIERVYAPSLEKQASVLAHHLYQAGTAADVDKTISYLTLASDQAREAAAHEESLALVDQALSLWEGDTGRHVRDLHARRAGALRSLGQTGEAVAAYERAMMLFDEAGDVENLAVTAIELAALQAWNARIDESTRVTDRALERLGSGAPALRCRLLLRRAGTLGASGNVNGALAALTEARALQETLGDPALACYAAVMETRVWYYAARPDRSVEAYRDALQQCRALGDLWSEAEIAHTNVLSSIMCGRPAHAMRLIEERVPLAEHLGHHSLMWALKAARALEALYRGQLEAAESGGRQSLAFGQAVQTGWHYLDCLALGLIGTFQGRPREATVHLQQAIDSEPKTVGLRIAVPTFAWALAHEGDVSGADDLLGARPLQLPERGQIQNGGELSSLVILIETLALLGRRDEAAPLHVWADDLVATGIHCPYWSATMVATAAGVAAACAKEWSRAEAHHQRAIQQADAAYRICQPDARAWYADMLLERGAAGDSARARFLLSEALALYESIGMPNFARRTSARLATVQ